MPELFIFVQIPSEVPFATAAVGSTTILRLSSDQLHTSSEIAPRDPSKESLVQHIYLNKGLGPSEIYMTVFTRLDLGPYRGTRTPHVAEV